MRLKQIIPKAKVYQKYYSELNIDSMILYFHTRYQDKNFYRNLKHNDSMKEIDTILMKKFSELNAEEKLTLMIYVVYRYRNNIFHGNKEVLSWSKYSCQIEQCIQFMMLIIDCDSKYKHEIVN